MSQATSTNGEAQYDVVVVGGGAAGLNGALALVRSRRSVLVVDSGQPRNAPAAHMHNYLSRDGTSPIELLAIGRAEVQGYGGEVVNGSVEAIERLGESKSDGFRVTLANGNSVRARRLLIATGAIDELPDVPGVAERWGRDVIHCPYCHGWEVRDQAIGILVTTPMAVHSALMFRQLSANVVVFQHTAPPLPPEQAEQLAARGIAVIEGEVAALEIRDDQLVGVRLRSGEIVPLQALAVQTRALARAHFLGGLGLETTELKMGDYVYGTAIAADAMGATSVPGVWVAGNLTEPMAQVIAAATAGLRAGAIINGDLVNEEAAEAVAALRDDAVAAAGPHAA